MKKIIFLLALLYGATLMAQNKAVAVTEVVDKEDKVSYATEIMVRTRLTAAISMKQGYTAYDRVDLQSIMSEQNFQRTGLVDDATIKRLGEMTGASLILIPEVAMSDDGKIYVAVKMLDVTTAQTMMSTGQLMESSSDAVEEGCLSLLMKILGEGNRTTNTTVSTAEPVTLFGYLHVFPTDVGEFQTLPAQLLSAINSQAQYGYDTWRLPTMEELSIMRANSHLIPNFRNTDYLCSDSSVKGLARLVTTEMSLAEKKETREKNEKIKMKAIFNLLDIQSDFNDYIILDTVVLNACKHTFAYGKNNSNMRSSLSHPNKNFRYTFDQSLVREYLMSVSDPNMMIIIDINDQRFEYHNSDYTSDYLGYEIYLSNLMLLDRTGQTKVHQLNGRRDVYLPSTNNKWTTEYYTCFCLYQAPLPSEQSIAQEMRRIMSALEM